MHQAHIDISRGLDGETVVFACLDLREQEVAAAAHAVAATAAERYRTPRISADDVLELRELTALADELAHALPSHEREADEADPGMPGSMAGEGPTGIEPGRDVRDGSSPGIEPGQGILRMVFRPARLSVLRDAVAEFVESRDEGDWIRDEDREPLAILRGMLLPLEQLCVAAMRAALSPESFAR